MHVAPLPISDPTGSRTAAFVRLVRDEDAARGLATVADDALVLVGAGLALEAYEGRWAAARHAAASRFGIPEDIVELLTAAALCTLTPTMGAFVLARPNEATLDELREWLANYGYRATPARAAMSAGTALA
ncbi:hypothetical protein [Microbacterium sufflavum]|uniref:Uncharacterized protein n=1 Tax=Microbacterium sufflavum TaxID=2851649 RepID=A0ABY4ILX8_9MICO|nr:hypothetical protein [Microbacterium sufflavum]UPL12593.1 hypothetical protein KV394_16430 [Microbacterium sufflavum]